MPAIGRRRIGLLIAAVGWLLTGCGGTRAAAPTPTVRAAPEPTAPASPTPTVEASPAPTAGVSPIPAVGPSTAATAPITSAPEATPAGAPPGPSASEPCGITASAAGYQHVVWIIMENRGYRDVVGSSSAPYLAGVARACGLATNYSGVAHPSLPNYIALTSGSTHGIGDDNGPGSHPTSGPSIFSLLGDGWRSLEESMPATCDRNSAGGYAVKHNPAPYYTDLGPSCQSHDVPLGSVPDVTSRFTLITPNLCHDMHDCSTATGDRWLAGELPQILDSATYRAGHAAVFVTWDENDSGGSTVPTYVIAPSVRPGIRSGTNFTHYSLLRTTEELLGLQPLLGTAATANSMATAFNL